jgi:transposase
LAGMKPTYEQLETELSNTKIELASTKAELAETKSALIQMGRLLKVALEKITELEERINLNSNNSSKPPSTDQKANGGKKERKKRESRKGVSRAPFSADRIDHQLNCTRENCAHCGADTIVLLNILPKILQQVELPEVRAVVTEYLLQKYQCHSCGKHSVADLPQGVPNSVFGPRVIALFATLTGVFHLAKREAIQLIKDLYDVDIGLGSSSNIEERVTTALDPIYQRINQTVLEGGFCKHFDETSWRTNSKRCYVWVASCKAAACYRIDPSRSREAFRTLIGGDPSDLEKVVTDRYAVYSTISKLHQYCLAHLVRDFKRFSERECDDGPIGEALAKELAKACKIHGEYREGNTTKKQRNMRLGHLKRRVQSWLEDGHANGSDKLSRICESLLNNFDKLWAFVKVDDMEPTNNLAERDMRKLVIWRKKSFGTKSRRGEKFVERITSVAETLKRHGKNILRFLEQAVVSLYGCGGAPEICPTLGI